MLLLNEDMPDIINLSHDFKLCDLMHLSVSYASDYFVTISINTYLTIFMFTMMFYKSFPSVVSSSMSMR